MPDKREIPFPTPSSILLLFFTSGKINEISKGLTQVSVENVNLSGNALMKAKRFYFRGHKATFPGGGGCGRRDFLTLTVSFLKQILHRLLSSDLNGFT